MNAVEIADAVADLFAKPLDAVEFPFEFLQAFGNKETTIKRLRKGDSNASDVSGGVLQRNNVHLAVCQPGEVAAALRALKASPQTAKGKAKFALATDGEWLAAEDLRTGEPLECAYAETPNRVGFFLELGGISTVREIKDNPIDIRATGRLNKLYLELLNANEDWRVEARRPDLNHFFARLIFCFFAEDTHIFIGDGLFTQTVEQMTESDGSNTAYVVGKLFEAMNLSPEAKKTASLPGWAEQFPYVNGDLFSGSLEVPRFTRLARSYLLRAGELNWREINPDIFGSMIQAVADDEERGALGMHYTSVPNIRKVLDPLFLDDLRGELERAGDSPQKLLNLRKRMARIRVFDPACGSGNFLVVAYRQMREIEAEVNLRRREADRPSDIPLTNFRGIEIRDFAAEVARLALIIAEYQADVRHRGERLALAEFLPLQKENWIWKGNALRLDWTTVCPPTGDVVRVRADNLFENPLDQTEMDFANAGGETYICGNPPYKGSQWQTAEQKADLKAVCAERAAHWKSLDYVAGWFMKAALYARCTNTATAFVATNSICQGRHIETLWRPIFALGQSIAFAHTSFKWSNLASQKAGVTVVIVGMSATPGKTRCLYSTSDEGSVSVKEVENINAYLVPAPNVIVQSSATPLSQLPEMQFGNHPYYGSDLIFSWDEARRLIADDPLIERFIRPFYGSQELVNGRSRACLWIGDDQYEATSRMPLLVAKFGLVAESRQAVKGDATAKKLADKPYRFREQTEAGNLTLAVPRVSSENRPYLPVELLNSHAIVQEKAFALYDAPLWNLALIASRLHWVWIGTVCVRMRMDFSYSNTLGWNTFPVPTLTEKNREDLTRCAEEILLARERHFPATIADLYAPDAMPDDLRRAHERNDETLEAIYIGRRFRNDTERLEELFKLYTAMTAKEMGKEAMVKRGKGNAEKVAPDESLL